MTSASTYTALFVSQPREPELSAEERAAFLRGVREFNDGYYFECHDTLEDLWSGLRGDARDFFQGLIQVSVGHYHLGNGNRAGAARMFERSLARLERYPARYFGFDVSRQRDELVARLRALAAKDSLEETGARPHWAFELVASEGP